jgi:hypothetical protein
MNDVVKYKLFGPLVSRVSTEEMNLVYSELTGLIGRNFSKFLLSRVLQTKVDHGDVDICVLNDTKTNTSTIVKNHLSERIVKDNHNGPIYSIAFKSDKTNKIVHVDFISAPANEFDCAYMYLDYSDFSGILGVVARRLKFNYGSTGFYKIFVDSRNQYHYILLTRSLRDGLMMLGYKMVLDAYDNIKSAEDVAAFITSSELFDSSYLESNLLNRGDRKRMRSGRPTAQKIKDLLIDAKKGRTVMDDDHYLKTLFPDIHHKYVEECSKINDYVFQQPKYNGHWILNKFPTLVPGPKIKQIQMAWHNIYGDQLASATDSDLYMQTVHIINNLDKK